MKLVWIVESMQEASKTFVFREDGGISKSSELIGFSQPFSAGASNSDLAKIGLPGKDLVTSVMAVEGVYAVAITYDYLKVFARPRISWDILDPILHQAIEGVIGEFTPLFGVSDMTPPQSMTDIEKIILAQLEDS